MLRLTRTRDLMKIQELSRDLFESTFWDVDYNNYSWWLARVDGDIAGMCGVRIDKEQGQAYLSLAGVLPKYRGRGIQKNMIKTRIKKAKKEGCTTVSTYVAWNNLASANSLISCGFKMFQPSPAWKEDEDSWMYFTKEL